MSYDTDRVDMFRQAASYVDRILRGDKPADLPVQAPTKYETVVNLKTAKALGLDRAARAAGGRRRGDRMSLRPRALSDSGRSYWWSIVPGHSATRLVQKSRMPQPTQVCPLTA